MKCSKCNNRSIMVCVGCGRSFCGQHGWGECPGCGISGEALMPSEHTPWFAVHRLGYDIASTIGNLEQTKFGRMVQAAVDSL
jgi:hypothetical protein